MVIIYGLKLNRIIIGGLYQGFFEVTNGNISHLFVTLGAILWFYFIINCLAANKNHVNLIIHRSPFSPVQLFGKAPIIIALFSVFVVSTTNDLFTFLGYSNKYLMFFKFAAFYLVWAYATLCLCIYYSGRVSTTYCIGNGFIQIAKQSGYILLVIAILAGVTFGSMLIGSKLTGQNIILLSDYTILGVIKALCTTGAVVLGIGLYQRSEIQKFCTNCI